MAGMEPYVQTVCPLKTAVSEQNESLFTHTHTHTHTHTRTPVLSIQLLLEATARVLESACAGMAIQETIASWVSSIFASVHITVSTTLLSHAAPTSTVIHQARSPVMITASTPTPDLASSEASTYIVTPSLNGVDEATSHISKKTEMIVLPTVGGVAPGAKSTNRWSVSMTLTMVAGAGGLLLLLMMLLCILHFLWPQKEVRIIFVKIYHII